MRSRNQNLARLLAEKGAKLDWKEFKHGPALLEAINAGEVDIGHVGETPPVFAQAGNVPFVYVARDPPAPKTEALVVRKDSPIRSVAALKGKKIALNRGSNVVGTARALAALGSSMSNARDPLSLAACPAPGRARGGSRDGSG